MYTSKRIHEPGHYMLKIESFSLLSEAKTFKIESDVFEASGHEWRLDFHPNGNEYEDEYDHISLYVIICDTRTRPDGWEVCADVKLFVYDHIGHNYVIFQDLKGNRATFNEKKTSWGFDKLISLKSFLNSENGYLFNDSCVFGVEIFEAPKYTKKDRCLSLIKPPEPINTHTWTINKFSTETKKVLYSDVFKVGKVMWQLYLYPKGTKSGEGTHLSIYLGVHDVASLPDGWKVYTSFTIRVKSQSDNDDIELEDETMLCNSSVDWGFARFMLLSELTNSRNGFLLNDILTVEVEISLMGMLKNFI